MSMASKPPLSDPRTIHASTVALNGRGCLILGPSGTGKSTLALQLMAHGAVLVADDQTTLVARDGALIASAPPVLQGKIEARGIGLLRAQFLSEAPLHLAVDLGRPEPDRYPSAHLWSAENIALPLVLAGGSAQAWLGILQYLKEGRDI
ncbi:HPr kinase/phosphorylase [Albirhodobacter sp. R86504]|uniref:HPr kinase/phosphorylase n=1 Tax=Albirhodobacter sp. R86504 TaxID=3093848 RepID=UPI00366F4EFB